MAFTPAQLLAKFDELGIETETREHAPVFTVAESKRLRGDLAGGHCKSLFLKDKKGALWLVVALEDRAIEMKALRRTIGAAPLSFARPEILADVLGITPGAVTPFALVNDTRLRVRVVLDAAMMGETVLNYHPLTNAATTSISPADLLAFIRACGHEPAILAL
jgi:Ala-tRNA(Pro) deacylase